MAAPHKHEWRYYPSDDTNECKDCGLVEYGAGGPITYSTAAKLSASPLPSRRGGRDPDFSTILSIDPSREQMEFRTLDHAGTFTVTFGQLEEWIKLQGGGRPPGIPAIGTREGHNISVAIRKARDRTAGFRGGRGGVGAGGVVHSGFASGGIIPSTPGGMPTWAAGPKLGAPPSGPARSFEHPVFGRAVSVNREEATATFTRGSGDETEISGDMVVSLAEALSRAGALSAEAAKAMTEAFMRISELSEAIWDATESSHMSGPDQAIEAIIADVRDQPDPDERMQMVSRYLTKITNELTALTREEEEGTDGR